MEESKDQETVAGTDDVLEESGAMEDDTHLDEEADGLDDSAILEEAEKEDGDAEEQYDEEVMDDEAADEEAKQPADESALDKSDKAEDGEEKKEGDDLDGEEKKEGDDLDGEEKKEGDDLDGEEEEAVEEESHKYDPNEVPQVDVSILAKRKWQVKVYPLKGQDFINGQIARVFSNARESLLYIIGPARHSGGKGEMYISNEIQAARVVQNLMKLDFKSDEVNIEIIKKSDDDVIEEKAFMRFDAKLVRILCVPVFGRGRVGIRRDQIIGSVFVKNLPNGTSKEMLRAMFPFAPEINFNPEKFKDGTARLVLSTRSAVVPCLRAFTKVELNGQTLELRPLERKPRSSPDPEKRSKKESTSKEDGKETPKKSPGSSKSADEKKDKKDGKDDDGKTRSDSTSKDTPKSKSDDRRDDRSRSMSDRRHRVPLGPRRGGDSSGFRSRRGGASFGQYGIRSRFRGGSTFANRDRFDDRRRAGSPRSSGDLGLTTETAKEMLLLQNQLSVAVKNQMAMLNQTNIALEQARREAAGLSLAREAVHASGRLPDQYGLGGHDADRVRRRPTDGNRRGQDRRRFADQGDGRRSGAEGNFGYKRNAGTAALATDRGGVRFAKRRNTGQGERGDGARWAEDRAYGGHAQHLAYGAAAREVDDREADFLRLHQDLSYGSTGYGYRY